MLLLDYLKTSRISKYRCAKDLKVNWMTVHRWVKGLHEPQPDMKKAVKDWSGGMVTEWPKVIAH